MTTVSFIICSHRAPETIKVTLRSIFLQLHADDTEIVLVNNGFSQEKATEIYSYAESFGKSKFISIVDEPRPGLGNARIKGFHSSSGKYLVLLDDDNYIASDFLIKFRHIIDSKPEVGGICPLVTADWELVPAEWLQDFGRFCLSYNASGKYVPEINEMEWGASQFDQIIRPPGGGMIINRIVADEYVKEVNDQHRIDLSRQPDSLVGCEDYDLYSFVGRLAMNSLFTDQLRLFHRIPAYRTRMEYLVRLNFQMIYSFGALRVFRREESETLPLISYKALRQLCSHMRNLVKMPGDWRRSLLFAIREIAYLLGVYHGRRKISGSTTDNLAI